MLTVNDWEDEEAVELTPSLETATTLNVTIPWTSVGDLRYTPLLNWLAVIVVVPDPSLDPTAFPETSTKL